MAASSLSFLPFLCLLAALAPRGLAAPTDEGLSRHSHNAKTSLTFLFQNNLNATDSANHVGAIMLDPMLQGEAEAACEDIGETLISRAALAEHEADFLHQFAYLQYESRRRDEPLGGRHYYIADGVVSANEQFSELTFSALPSSSSPQQRQSHLRLQALCTQTGNVTSDARPSGPGAKELTVHSNGNSFIGIRNQKSFRFLGIPFADAPGRFEYSQLYSAKGQTIRATAYGSECMQQYGGGSEDCLFLNIQTPYLPRQGSHDSNLRPVMFWIYGGGFVGGSSSSAGTDGGDLASREDIVVVSCNYRLSTLGFLAVPGTDIKGNFGIADQLTALEWTIQNIAQFGGDPNRITIIGESAGAGSVRALLGSPPALGKFQGAVSMSNLGGGVGLGLNGDYATTYSNYLTVDESYAIAGQQIFLEAGCNQTELSSQISCLKGVPALSLVSLDTVARYVVQDGHYITTSQLNVAQPHNNTGGDDSRTAHVPVIFGIAANDGASFSTYPRPPVSTQRQGIEAALGISAYWAQQIIDSALFPYYNTGNVTLDSFNVSQRVATDLQFRCIDQATVYAGSASGVFPRAYFYQMDRTGQGYNPNGLGGAPVVLPAFPNGDPNLPYFRLHGSDLPWVFGTPITLRDPADLYSQQLVSGYFAQFVKSLQPNPSVGYLRARGYLHTLDAVQRYGPWDSVQDSSGPIHLLNYPSTRAPFQDLEQCAWLNYSIGYYLAA